MAKYTLSDLFPGNFRISQYYGANASYYQQFGLRGHEGVDWALPVGIQLLCPFTTGRILRTGWDRAYGYFVVVWDEKQRCAVWYAHMSRIDVKPGQIVKRFQVVGLSGKTGNVTGPHLHCNFVETDAYGRRLNMTNGYQGYINILKPGLVAWSLSK